MKYSSAENLAQLDLIVKMRALIALIILLTLLIVGGLIAGLTLFLISSNDEPELKSYKFPEGFKFGAASASYQIEGGWNLDGKGENIWDHLVHENPELIADKTNGDVGPDSYHYYKEDVKALKNAGMEIYRFSVSWARIMPDNVTVNQAGIDYYNRLIDELISAGIEPMITMYHWDLPQYIQDLGGFMDPILVGFYERYADILFKSFGDRVKKWITFNEPFIFCVDGYSAAILAPLVKAPGVGEYLCAHHMLQSHAAAYKLYNDKYRQQQNGQVGICLFSNFFYPAKDVNPQVAEDTQQFLLGWFTNSIFTKEGGYPKVMVDAIAKKSALEGRSESRLPVMSEEMRKSLIGSADFLALNYYTSRYVTPTNATPTEVIWDTDTGVDFSIDKNWKKGKSEWLFSVPSGLYDILKWIKEKYNNPTVMITENGWSDDGQLNDDDRIDYLKAHLASISRAINEDNCKVIAYTVWSIIDNFEWMKGFSEKFGIYAVNLTSPTKERTAKKSVGFFQDLSRDRSFLY